MGSFPTLDPDSCEPSLIALKSSLFPKADFFPSRLPGAWRPRRAWSACGPAGGRPVREWQASPLGPPVGSGRPCRWALSSSGVLPQGFSQSQGQGDWGVRSPRGTVCQWGQEGQRQRGPPPSTPTERGRDSGCRGRHCRLPPWPPRLTWGGQATARSPAAVTPDPSDLRPLAVVRSLDGGGTSPFASSSLPPGAVSGRSQELQLTSRQRECARGRGRVLVAGVPRGRLWLTRRCGSRRDQRSHAGAAVHLGGGGGRRPRR